MTDDEELEILNSLWNNFCISDTYEPGSTFKPFTVAAGLELGILDGDETYDCTGMMHVGDDDVYCHLRTGHGTETLKQAVENSCNVALMQIAQSIGEEQFCRYQNLFGFGCYTGIDLPGEGDTSGLLYTPDNMDPASLATNAFGQNFNVTMTQMAAAFCSLINGGDYYEPHVVKQIQDENGNVTENIDPVVLKKTVSAETSELVKEYMLGVVEEGTGTGAAVEGYDVGGKTGTAEKLPRGNEKYLISFIGYAPQENPEVMIYVIIDEPNVESQDTSSLVTALAADIMKDIFPYLGITKSSKATTTADTTADTSDDTSDDSYSTDDYTDDSYSADDYTDDSYTDDYSDSYSDDYTDDYTDDSYTEDIYTEDYYTDDSYLYDYYGDY
jgi:stage V sporulation protein D (sporulation-specific penicillin-binding protein)